MSLESWLDATKQPTLAKAAANSANLARWCVPRRLITEDILEGLAFLHSVGKGNQGIIHRDIKMANVLINTTGSGLDVVVSKAVITDFGFCCVPGSDFETPGTV